ncbi:aspartate kinase [Thermogemmatispora carboxidivorans]|uniref:aspartate kinase n=1 Tax=Thermogemmatispora carboxidivorans TaxID=1382306 RepID=UPI00069A60BD|nr:aspartate kinase [Thermogemmatispora carboxidivorans]
MDVECSLCVLKFGGTSVGSGERIRRVAQIVAQAASKALNEAAPFPVVVVSAMSGITDQLLRIAQFARRGESLEWRRELAALRERHLQAAEKAVHDGKRLAELRAALEETLAGLEREAAGCEDYVDAVAAWGERLSVLLLAAAINDLSLPGVAAAPVREEVIVTGEPQGSAPSEPGAVIGAEPLEEETRARAQLLLQPLLQGRTVPVAPGFIGRTPAGLVTTLGRNGSDYSATVIGAAIDCCEVAIYTDVDGVMSADPRIVANARLLPALTYAEAARLSWFGAKVLHPRTLIPVAQRNIPVRVRNTFRPQMQGTLIGPEGRYHSGATAITVRRRLALVTVESTNMFGAPENAGQVFALAARVGAAPVAICSSSGHHLSFMVEEQAAASVVSLLQHDLGHWRVSCRLGLAACACLGSGFTSDPMSPARAISALARERIPVISQGASEQGIMLIIEDGDSERALRCLHRDLIAPVIPLVRHPAHEKRLEALKAR